MPPMERFLWICLAGAAGTGARYLVSMWAVARFGPTFPLGTLLVNLAGCFLMALLVEAAFRSGWPETLRLAVTAGFLGGLTTYSSFNFEGTRLLENGAGGMAGAYALMTIVGAFVAGLAGLALGRHLFAA
jgi:fluoride exporter